MSSASDPNAPKDRSRTPPPRGDAIAKEFDDMWATLEPKLNVFKEGVKDAVKGPVRTKVNKDASLNSVGAVSVYWA